MNELDKAIGTKEREKLTASDVIVETVLIEEHPTKKGGKVKIVTFGAKHPQQEEPIRLSNIKIKIVQGNNETIKKDGIWYREDEDGLIQKDCNTAILMNYYSVTNLKSFIGQILHTELDAQGYLVIKCY